MGSFQFSVFSFQYTEPGARRAGRGGAVSTQYSAPSKPAAGHQFAICNLHFSFCNRPYRLPAPRSLLRAHRGLTLIEVLASIGVLTIGLLSLAALLPVGQVTLFEAIKADRAGTCGRAAMRDVVVRRMLDFHNWYDPYQNKFVYDPSYNGGSNWSKAWYDQSGNPTANLPASFIIDPFGATSGSLNSTLGNTLTVAGTQTSWLTNVPRISLATIYPPYPDSKRRPVVLSTVHKRDGVVGLPRCGRSGRAPAGEYDSAAASGPALAAVGHRQSELASIPGRLFVVPLRFAGVAIEPQ